MANIVEYLLAQWAIIIIQVRANDLIYDYFSYKNLSRLNLFSCEQTENDFRVVRTMNELGISVAVHHPSLEFYETSESIVRLDDWPIGLLLDTRCQNNLVNEKIISQTSKYRLYDGIHVWLILGWNLTKITKLLNDSSYSIQTDLAVGVPNENGYDIYDVYNPSKSHGGSLNVTKLGYWNSLQGLRITLNATKFTRRSNLQGMTITAVGVAKYVLPGMTVEEHLLDYTRKSRDSFTKYGYGVLLHVGDLFNFSIKAISHEEWLATINGTEVGAMVLLHKGEADIQITGASLIDKYLSKPYGHVLVPGYPFRTCFIFHSRGNDKMKWLELLTPFAIDSWYAIFVTAIFSIAVITAIQTTEYGEGWFAESGHAIFATFGALCQQGLVFVPNRLAGRIAFLFLLLLGVLLSNYYGASIVSSRLNEPVEKMNDSLYSLSKSRMTLTSEPYRSYMDIVLEGRAQVEWEASYFYERWKKLPMSKWVPAEEGLSKAGEKYAFHTTPEVAYPYIETHWNEEAICDMTEVQVVPPRILYFWDRTDGPFSELLRVGLSKVQDMGLRSRNLKRWKPRVPYCSPDARTLQSITIFDTAPALMLLIAGIVLSVIICYAEIIAFRLNPERIDEATKIKKKRIVGKKTLQRAQKN